MITKGCGLLGLVAAAMMFPWTLNDASAAGFVEITKPVTLNPKPPVSVTTSSDIKSKVQFNERFSSVSNICFQSIFIDDLLDYGDDLAMDFSKEVRGAGFFNPGPESQSSRVICFSDVYNPEVVNLFLDGKQDIGIIMNHGSVTIGSLSATISGYSQ